MPLGQDAVDFKDLYKSLYRIRRVEEEIIRLYPTDKIKSPVHLSIGQESVSIGVCRSLRPSDIVFGTYRGHALYLAKGGDIRRMMAELYGKVDGCARGKAGSMHLIDLEVGMMGTSAIVATSIPHAVGFALAEKMKGGDRLVVCFFGEGATDEGVFHESMNFASLKRLPILFVCENNLYAIYSHVSSRLAGAGLCDRAASYGIAAERVEGGDTLAIAAATARMAAEIRAGGGPRFLECMTCRWRDHVGPGEDRVYGYRTDEELDDWIARDELRRMAGHLDSETRVSVERAVEAEIADAIAYAEESAYPQDEEVFQHVYHD
jgi:TPP-dependent pyruvate/acetoin dehydrogenase alpha subunit